MRFHIVGIDQSLTSTGIARIRPHVEGDGKIKLDIVRSAPVPNAKYPHTLARLRQLAGDIVRAIRVDREEGDITIVALEGPAYGMSGDQRGHHVRAGLFWLLYHLLEKEAIVVIISPSSLKRYVTGKGNAAKDLVLTTIVRNFPSVGIVDNNEADALALGSMIARELGLPIEPSVQRVTPSALEGVDWPEAITQQRRIQNAI